jgi:hypothetical protein
LHDAARYAQDEGDFQAAVEWKKLAMLHAAGMTGAQEILRAAMSKNRVADSAALAEALLPSLKEASATTDAAVTKAA